MVELRLISRSDLSAVADIERLSFSEPWSEDALSLLLSDGGFGIVALVDGSVAAYGGMTYMLDEGSVTNIATHPDYRRRGLGRALLRAMLSEAEKRGITSVFLEVRVSNAAARSLYASEGFSEIGVRRGFYRRPAEDALALVYRINN